MSAHAESEHAVAHQHAADEVTTHHGSFKDYLTGFALAVALTAIPFWIVMDNAFRVPATAVVVILIFAFVQIVVHMVYFLHMNSKSEGGWTLMALLFTGVMLIIMLSGSLWVMQHLDSNMMPMSPAQMRNMP
ncbi:MAG: cytochrome o ubiquinol oxidase subunit IV [Acetobacteraceae bacterium]|nr:cytochrome o ubiquinol oxidase subunit IV [Acetobacteraceae bacterium]MBV8524395.1 cytochrome o ubiquinol oxidase subunit IV [Acetobacteraceae bacterium]MBV8589656.1 cytochrome o ubiquinol oxidase subunit IV [Acetobacteraceae bacterium]